MEYLIIVLFGALLFNQAAKTEEPVPVPLVQVESPKPILDVNPTFKPNHYVLDRENGYYTSDLSARSASSQPVVTTQEAD